MRLLSQFSKKFQDTIKPEEMYDSIRGIYKCAEKIVVGTFSENDSTTLMSVNVDKMASFSFSLNLKSINNPVSGQNMYFYKTRPFIVGECRTDEFIPLVFYGSSWFDSKYNVIRFCGESELNPDMSDQIIKDVPHSFVLGFFDNRDDRLKQKRLPTSAGVFVLIFKIVGYVGDYSHCLEIWGELVAVGNRELALGG